MTSIRAGLTKYFLRKKFKPALGKLLADSENLPTNIRGFRDALEARPRKQGIPRGVSITPWADAPGTSEIVTPNDIRTDWSMLYLHGGGFQFGSPVTHRAITGFFARNLPAKVFVPNYRLAPEHRFPAGLDDAVAGYKAMLDSGIAADHIVLAGDSAGGGLVLSMLYRLRDENVPLPRAAALMSPFTDLTMSGQSTTLNSERDVMFSKEVFAKGAQIYYGDASPNDPLVSPVFGDLRGLPPILVHASKDECLLDDSTRLDAKARVLGADLKLELFDGLPHVWHVFCGQFPEADRDALSLALFLRAQLQLQEIL